ncbi:keratin, type I cytoskeletal 9 isoform X3 [Bombyx mori]|uniref:keratin, type I cytoskeletal 9 isoform X3 n=1 Tax=Bombyx mori TaxID=7091 RepID=UPI002ED35636
MSQVTVSSSHRDAEINEVQTGNATLEESSSSAAPPEDTASYLQVVVEKRRRQRATASVGTQTPRRPAASSPRRACHVPRPSHTSNCGEGAAGDASPQPPRRYDTEKKSKGSILEEIEDDIDNNVIDDGKSKSGARVCVPRVRRRVRGGAGGRAGVGSGAGGAAGAAITGAGAGGAAGGTARAARAARRHPVATSPVTVHFQPLMHVRGMVVSGGRVRARGGGGRGAAGAGGVRGRVCGARAARRTGAAAGGARHAASARTGAARRGRGTRETVPGPEARARRALCVFFTLTLALAHFSLVFNK